MIRTGIVTVLFTDLVDSSRLLGRFGDEEADRIRRGHFRALRRLLDRFGGREVKSLGDGLMVVFPSAVSAVSCAIEMQCVTMARNEEDPDRAVGVRIGIHAGEPIQEGDDYYGTVVVVAKRLCDLAQGGQIEVSDLVRGIIGPRGGFRFDPIGPVSLKGIDPPTQAWEVDWHEVADGSGVAPEEELEHRSGPLKRAVPWIALLAAIVSGVIVGALLYGEDESRTGPRRGPSEAPGDQESDGAAGSPPRLVWSKGSIREGSMGPAKQKVHRIIEARGRLYAVGVDGEDAGIWTSKNGMRWAQLKDRALRGPGSQSAWGIVEWNGLLVMVGAAKDDLGADAAVWISEDGSTWRRVGRSDPDLGGSGTQTMNRIASSPHGGLVAVGYVDPLLDGQWDAAVWRSRDGRHWRRIHHDSFEGPGLQEMRGVASNGDVIVAVGEERVDSEVGAVVWVSRDGRRWRRVRDFDLGSLEGESGQLMTSVAWGHGSFFAVGHDYPRGDKDAAVWSSPDGRRWTRFLSNEKVFGGSDDQRMWGITPTEDGWVAAGENKAGGGSDAAVWLFEGGKWRRARGGESIFGGDQEQVMKSVIEFKGELVGAGWELVDGDNDAAMWHASRER